MVSMLERINFDEDFHKEIEVFSEGLLEAGFERYRVAEGTMDFSASLADEYILLSGVIYSSALIGFLGI